MAATLVCINQYQDEKKHIETAAVLTHKGHQIMFFFPGTKGLSKQTFILLEVPTSLPRRYTRRVKKRVISKRREQHILNTVRLNSFQDLINIEL